MKGLILSGGKGSRLYPLTFTNAKQLIPVANKPVLVRVIECLRDAGIVEIGIVIGNTGPKIKKAIGNGDEWGGQRHLHPARSAVRIGPRRQSVGRFSRRRPLRHVPRRQCN